MVTAPSPAHIAARLALACELDWGRWAAGHPAPKPPTPEQVEHARRALRAHTRGNYHTEHPKAEAWLRGYRSALAVPVPDPIDAGAYLADCERRGVDPGPMPALSWEGECLSWSVAHGPVARIRVGRFHATRHYSWGAWRVDTAGDHGTAEQLATLARLVAAADGAT